MTTIEERRAIRLRKKMRRRRTITELVIVTALTFVVSLATVSIIDGGWRDTDWKITEYTVSKGDTLWTIADKFSTDEDDRREYIHKISEYNDLETADLDIGQTLYIFERK